MNFNNIVLIGNLTRDPELFGQDSQVCSFGMAVNRRWKSQSGEQKEEVMFIDVKVFGKGATIAHQYLKKGHEVLVHGRLAQEHWDDKQSGQKRSKHVIHADPFGITFGNKKDNEGGSGGSNGSSQSQTTRSEPAGQPAGGQKPADEINFDDIPF